MAPPRHMWTLSERDCVSIVYGEYNLNMDQAHAIFDSIFPRVASRASVRDEWITRGKTGKNPAWATTHDKPLAQYNAVEQARRAGVRVQIVTAAQPLGIVLTPVVNPASDPTGTALLVLHNAALATLAINAPPPAAAPPHPPAVVLPPLAQLTQAPQQQQAAGAAPHQSTAPASGAPPAQTPSASTSNAPPGPSRSTRSGQTPGVAVQAANLQAPPAAPPTYLAMVHDEDLRQNRDDNDKFRAGEPHFRSQHSLKRGPEDSMYRFGGHVDTVMFEADANHPRGAEDVFVCHRNYCIECVVDHRHLRVGNPTSGRPFVHSTACFVSPTGELTFQPRLDEWYRTDRPLQLRPEKVRYTVGAHTLLVDSAVCVMASCACCNPNPTVTPSAGDWANADGPPGSDDPTKDSAPPGESTSARKKGKQRATETDTQSQSQSQSLCTAQPRTSTGRAERFGAPRGGLRGGGSDTAEPNDQDEEREMD